MSVMQTFSSELVEKQPLTPHILRLRFSCPADFSFRAGQYVIVHVPVEGKPAARRLYSIASPPEQTSSLDLIVEIVSKGIGSDYLQKISQGDTATIQGPAGLFTYTPSENGSVFLATGTGIAPIRSMLLSLAQQKQEGTNKNIWLLWGLKQYEDTYHLEELRTLAEEHPWFHFCLCLSRQQGMENIPEQDRPYITLGHVQDAYHQHKKALSNVSSSENFYICGGRHVVEALKIFVEDQGISQENIHFEKF